MITQEKIRDLIVQGEGITLPRQTDDVLIESDLHNFLSERYQNEGITETEIKSIVQELESMPSSDLYESNKRFMKMLSDGFILKREDRSQKDVYIQLIHYGGLEQQKQNEKDLISIVAEPFDYQIADRNIYRFCYSIGNSRLRKARPRRYPVYQRFAFGCI